MIIGVPHEVKDHEARVALVPSGVSALRETGHQVVIQSGAGDQSAIFDADYEAAGAEVASRRLHRYTFAAVIAGQVSSSMLTLGDLHVILGSPEDEIKSLRADKPTLLWLVDWNADAARGGPLTKPNVHRELTV